MFRDVGNVDFAGLAAVDLQMQVRSGRHSRHSHDTDDVSGCNVLASAYRDIREVTVDRIERFVGAESVFDDDMQAEALIGAHVGDVIAYRVGDNLRTLTLSELL